MDPSALIFVALAVAWAAYLIPRALEHHEESNRSRSIEKFSDRMRVLARREPVGRRSSALVTRADEAASDHELAAEPEPAPVLSPEEHRTLARAHARAAVAAARRRRRVLDLLLLAVVVVAATCIGGVLPWVWLGAPAGVVVLWLVVCRVSVRRQRRRRPVPPVAVPTPAVSDVADTDLDGTDLDGTGLVETGLVRVIDETGQVVAVSVQEPTPAEPAPAPGWDPLPIMVPTYVVKEHVRRSVRTIDLDSTGVWSSGRSDIDSALVRDSDAAARAARDEAAGEQDDRAVGS